MKMKLGVILAVPIILITCINSQYFDLYIEPIRDENSPKIEKILLVEDINVNETFWHQRMVYRKSAYQVSYFSFKHWAKRPGELFKDVIIHYYKNSSLFTEVIDGNSSLEADIVMKIHIDSLEMAYKDKRWYAHLALDIEMVDILSEKTILKHYFDQYMRIKGKKAGYVPEKISKILQNELMKIIEKLRQTIENA